MNSPTDLNSSDSNTPKVYDLYSLGWNDFHQQSASRGTDAGWTIARVCSRQKNSYRVLTEHGEWDAVTTGKLRHGSTTTADFPVVGDWVFVVFSAAENKAVIHEVLPRRSKISRDTAMRTERRQMAEEQVLVANVDTIFLVASLNEELNPKRIERYLTMIWGGGARPVLILNKADLCQDIDEALSLLQEILRDVPVHVISAVTGRGIEQLDVYFKSGETIAFLGSSGVGKSTILNAILGKEQFRVHETSSYKDRGRHTTTQREMIMLQQGSLLIDNPGLRGVQIWEGEEGTAKSFADIEELAVQCRFNDCRHLAEPDCAVRAAIDAGSISQERYSNYLKLQKEHDFRARRENQPRQDSTKKRWKAIAKARRHLNQQEGR
jgi:ribosome biogenesis GTPase / thiamine phosphate phosphatase